MRLIRWFLHLMFACIPGCGQMYQGYMRRGLSQTILFCGGVTLAVFLEMGSLAIPLVPLWLYSFFDSYNLRRQLQEGYAVEDAYLFGLSDLDASRLEELLHKRHSVIGWTLLLVGVYNLYQLLARELLGWLSNLFPFLDGLYRLLVWEMPRILVTLVIIFLGLWFIREPRSRVREEELPFTPPQRPAAPPPPPPSPWTEAEARLHSQPEPQAPDIPPVTPPVWQSEFDVEKFEKSQEGTEETRHDGGAE